MKAIPSDWSRGWVVLFASLSNALRASIVAFPILSVAIPAHAHGPIFSPGPHTPFKGAYEPHIEYRQERASGAGEERTEQELVVGLGYGLTADLEVKVELPYVWKDEGGRAESGIGDMVVGTKYRFLRIDSPGLQRSIAAHFQIKLPTGDDDTAPRLGSGSTDYLGALSAGYEGRRWYGFASTRYRLNTEGAGGLRKGDRRFLDLTGGVRPWLTGYREPDWVFLLELNWEHAARDELNGKSVANSGGSEIFASPGIFWTLRNHAIRTGVQVPLSSDLNGTQAETDYRFKLGYEGHF